jgi:hypothetical protein
LVLAASSFLVLVMFRNAFVLRRGVITCNVAGCFARRSA